MILKGHTLTLQLAAIGKKAENKTKQKPQG